jgi:hypothetical protein
MIPPNESRTKNSVQSVREPPLRLEGFPNAERFGTLTDTHPAYALARFAWHYGPQLDDAAGRALLAALLTQWPSKQGRHAAALDDRRAALAARLGASPFEVAAAWRVEPNSAAKKIKRGDGARMGQSGTVTIRPRIVIVPDEGTLHEPRDPAADLDGILADDEPTPAEVRESRSRFADALAMGLPEHVTLAISLPAGTVAVERIPTASREAAWKVIDCAAESHGGYRDGFGPCFVDASGEDEQAQRFAVWLLSEGWPLLPEQASV